MISIPAVACRGAAAVLMAAALGCAHAPTPAAPGAAELPQSGAPSPRPINSFDVLEITVLDAPEFTRVVRVSEEGEISLPLLGLCPAAGRTPHELEVRLAERLRGTYMVDPHVTVHVKEAAPEPIYVVGEVNQPGAFTASGSNRLTVLQAVALARGTKPAASRRGAFVIRTLSDGQTAQLPVRLGDVIRGRAPDLVLQPNDIVYVPTNMERSVALGVVNTLVRVVTFRGVF